MSFLISAVSQGLLWAVMAIGIYITYRILDIADLTAEGCFTLGAAVAAKLITSGVDPFISTLISIVAGMMAGLVTGLLHTKLKIPALLSGILTMTALYSINLRVMGGVSNISLLNSKTLKTTTILSFFENTLGMSKTYAAGLVGIIVLIIVITLLWWFFHTEIGYMLRATGNNTNMVRALGVNTDSMKIMGLVIGNGLIGLSSALVGQYNGFADVGMGTGTIVIGLASVIIGEVVFGSSSILRSLISVALGSVLYRIIIAFILRVNIINASDLKMVSSLLLVVALTLPMMKQKFNGFIKVKKGGR